MNIARWKFPRTPHHPLSSSVSADDLIGSDCLKNKEVYITEKLDGECTTIYSDGYVHARSINSDQSHESRSWINMYANCVCWELQPGWRICGENLYAKHSISYNRLSSYFYGFAVFDAENICLSLEKTSSFFKNVGAVMPKVLYVGEYSERVIEKLSKTIITSETEGFVIRNVDSFSYEDYAKNTLKWVRPNHVQTNEHWLQTKIIKNGLL